MISATYLPAAAAFSGSAFGMLANAVSNWVVERRKHRVRHTAKHRNQRHKLYKRFIDEAARLYADALVTEKSEFSNLVNLYSLIARMRVVSSDAVVSEAEKVGRLIIDAYLAPNRTFPELAELLDEMDPLRSFSESCRKEL